MVNRNIFVKIWHHIDSPDVLLLTGPRQVGKTTLLLMLMQRLEQERHAAKETLHFFDLERADDASVWTNQSTTLASLPLSDQRKHYVFVDEFQHSHVIGSTAKVLHDHYPNIKLILTGSATWYLNIDESLAGRKRVIPIWPLSFHEFLQWKNNEEALNKYQRACAAPQTITRATCDYLNIFFVEFLTFGGYPRVVLAPTRDEKIQLLDELFNAYLLRDLRLTQFAESSPQLRKLLILLASRTSSTTELSSLAADVGIGRTALQNRLALLRNTFLLHDIRPFFTNKTKEIVKNPKSYLVDTGLRNILLQQFELTSGTQEFGVACENAVLLELLKNATTLTQLLFWRTKTGQEVDFILRSQNNLLPIEVKSGAATSIPSSLRSFIRQYHSNVAYVLNWNHVDEKNIDGCRIFFRPLWFPVKPHLPCSKLSHCSQNGIKGQV